jgi:hypothetical protein
MLCGSSVHSNLRVFGSHLLMKIAFLHRILLTLTIITAGATLKIRFNPLGNNQLKKFAFSACPSGLICKMTESAT